MFESPAEPAPTAGRWTLFDDQSRYLDHFGLLLALTYATISIASLVNTRQEFTGGAQGWGNLLFTVLGALMAMLAARASGLARRWKRGVDTFAILSVGAHILLLLAGTAELAPLGSQNPAPGVPTVLACASFAMVVRRLLRHRKVTMSTVLGSVTAYLFLALIFYYLFLIADMVPGHRFFGSQQPTSEFMYFSLSTITTLGYGQPAPETEVAQLLATTEAVVGQLFLVTFVAMIVGMLVSVRSTPAPETASAGATGAAAEQTAAGAMDVPPATTTRATDGVRPGTAPAAAD